MTLLILDLHDMNPPMVTALAALVVGLGVTYWLMRERDDRVRKARRLAQGHAAV